MTFFKRNWLLTLFVIAALGISGYFLYLSQQPPKLSEAPTPSVPKTSEPPAQPKPPVGDTSQGGHWHGDEWHADPHDTPTPAQVETPTPPVSEPTVPPSVAETQVQPTNKGTPLRNPTDTPAPQLGEPVKTPTKATPHDTVMQSFEIERKALERESVAIWELIEETKQRRVQWKELVAQSRELTAKYHEANAKIDENYAGRQLTAAEKAAREAALKTLFEAYRDQSLELQGRIDILDGQITHTIETIRASNNDLSRRSADFRQRQEAYKRQQEGSK